MRTATISGLGTALPRTVITNHDLTAWLDTSDDWIRSRSGIAARHIADHDESSTTLGADAAAAALADAGLTPADPDLVIVATASPQTAMPGDAARIQDRLGLRCGGFDLGAACAGFLYALSSASAMVASGNADTVLVIGAETMSRIVDPADRNTAVLFGDGAGAVVVTPAVSDGRDPAGVLGHDQGCDGSAAHLLEIRPGERYLHMDGREVFRRAVRAMADSSLAALEAAKHTVHDVDLFVPHQANARIIDATADRLGICRERTVTSVASTGNTSAASIPLALSAARDDGRLVAGGLVLLTAVGAGLSWASTVVRWT
ncbi:MAG TPA: beta-ketoacyl-ACP synthase III [Acidimicrobiales bacterium]